MIVMPNLSKREIMVLSLGVGFLVIFFGIQLGIAPVFEKRDNLTRILSDRQKGLEEMTLLSRQYAKAVGSQDLHAGDLARRTKGFSLFSFLDTQAEQSGVKANVAYMKPFTRKLDKSEHSLSTVKVKLTGVYLKNLMDFLFRIESSANAVDITSLSLTKTGKEQKTMDAVIETQTLMLKDTP